MGNLEHRHADVGHDVYLSTMSQEFLRASIFPRVDAGSMCELWTQSRGRKARGMNKQSVFIRSFGEETLTFR